MMKYNLKVLHSQNIVEQNLTKSYEKFQCVAMWNLEMKNHLTINAWFEDYMITMKLPHGKWFAIFMITVHIIFSKFNKLLSYIFDKKIAVQLYFHIFYLKWIL